MNYGDYKHKPFQIGVENIESTKSTSNKNSNLDSKTSEISHQVFPNIQLTSSKELKDISTQPLSEKLENNSSLKEEKSNSIDDALLSDGKEITEEIIIPNNIIDSTNASKSSRFDSMTLEELAVAMSDENLTAEEFDKIIEKIDLLESQISNENVEIKEENVELIEKKVEVKQENVEVKEEIVELKEDNKSKDQNIGKEQEKSIQGEEIEQKAVNKVNTNTNKINKMSNVRTLNKDGVWVKPTSSELGDNFITIDKILQGEISAPKGHNLVKGHTHKMEDDNGNIVEVPIKKINELSNKEVEEYKKSFVTYYNNLNQNNVDKEEKKRKDLDSESHILKNQPREKRNLEENLKIQNKQINSKAFIDVKLNGEKISTKEKNKEWREKVEKEQEILEEIIKKLNLNHEQLVHEIKSSDLSFDIKNMDEKSHELYVKCLENISQFQEIIKDIHKIKSESGIPLSTIARFIKLERTIKEFIKFIPKRSIGKDKNTYEAIIGVLSLTKEFIDQVQLLSSNNKINVTSTGNLGKTLGPI